MTEDLQAELDRLRAENAELSRARNSEDGARMNAGLSKLAAAANREAQQYRTLQAGGEIAVDLPVAQEAAMLVMQDMGLV